MHVIHPYMTKQRANSISAGIFLLALAIITYMERWWPSVIFVFGIAFALRQILLGKWYDGLLSLVVFGGIFITLKYELGWMPVIFTIAGIYLIFRNVMIPEEVDEEEEEVQKEMEEEKPPEV